MEELKKWDELSKDQKERLTKVLSKSKIDLLIKTVIFLGTLFLANTLSLFLGHSIMKEVDLFTWQLFCFFSSLVNSIFCIKYYLNQTNQINNKLKEQIKNIVS